MKSKIGNIVVTIFLLASVYTAILSTVNAADEPTVVSITHSPDKPTPQSTVTFNAVVVGDNISDVRLIIEECKVGLCYLQKNNTMRNIGLDEYQSEVTLVEEDTTYIKYHLQINSGGVWYKFAREQFDLKVESDGQTNGDGSDKTPGFELTLLMISIIIAMYLFNKKRVK